MPRSLVVIGSGPGIGVHVGLVIVAGSVAPEKTVLNPGNIAKKTYELFAQDRGGWTLETYLKE